MGVGPHFGLHLNLQSDKDVNNYNLHVNEGCEADFSQPTGAHRLIYSVHQLAAHDQLRELT